MLATVKDFRRGLDLRLKSGVFSVPHTSFEYFKRN